MLAAGACGACLWTRGRGADVAGWTDFGASGAGAHSEKAGGAGTLARLARCGRSSGRGMNGHRRRDARATSRTSRQARPERVPPKRPGSPSRWTRRAAPSVRVGLHREQARRGQRQVLDLGQPAPAVGQDHVVTDFSEKPRERSPDSYLALPTAELRQDASEQAQDHDKRSQPQQTAQCRIDHAGKGVGFRHLGRAHCARTGRTVSGPTAVGDCEGRHRPCRVSGAVRCGSQAHRILPCCWGSGLQPRWGGEGPAQPRR